MIYVQRTHGQDASQVAKLAAEQSGTTLVGNFRWYGPSGPIYREINTADGRGVRVYEPDYIACPVGTFAV